MTDTELPPVSKVRGLASSEAARTTGSVNLFVPAAGEPAADVERVVDDETRSYVGRDPAAVGLLAAAATAANGSELFRLQYPDPDPGADGPWVVLEPLGGRLATVTTGRATVRVTVERGDTSVHGRLTADSARSGAVLEAARPAHEHYPVEVDDDGVFTRGMTTFELAGVTAGDRLVVTFDTSTTPATTARGIRDRFADVEGVTDVDVERLAGVVRADPAGPLRSALEEAHAGVLGDYEYVWLPSDAGLAGVPTHDKVAVGTGTPGEPFTADAYGTCLELLGRTATKLEGAGR